MGLKPQGSGKVNYFLWKKKLRESNNDLSSLIPKSRSPMNKRKREIKKEIKEFIN